MKLLKLLAAALFALVPTAVYAAQNTYTMPTTGPLSMSSYSADVNSALGAILSNNSGASAPSVTGQPTAYQWWVDTSTTPRVLKLYDGTNWVAVGKLDTSGHLWGASASTLTLLGSTSGTVTVTPQAAAGTPTLTLPNASGTFAVNASSPLVLSATTGNLTCPTCVTSSGGGAVSGTAPVAVSGAGVVSITGAAGQVLAGASPAFTATPTLGVAGSALGTVTLAGSTSGSTTLQPNVAASGTLTLPAATDTLVGRATTDTLTNKTISGSSNTLSNVANGSLTNSTVTVAGHSVALGASTAVACGDLSNGATGCSTAVGTSGATLPLLNAANTWSGVQSHNSGDLALNGSSSGATTLNAAAAAGTTTVTLPAATDTLVGKATTDTLTNKTFDTAATGNSLSINGVAATANTGTGAVVRASGPTLSGPAIGAATATSINKVTITQPATGSTLTIADGKTATVNNSLTLAGTDSTTQTFPSTSATIARTDAAQTFTGAQTFSTPVALGSGGSGQATAAAARASTGFNIDEATTHGDSNYTILSTDRTVLTSANLTAPRTWTLPPANSVNPGQELDVRDAFGGVSGTNTLTLARAGSDTINGSTSAVISAQYDGRILKSDGVSAWHFIPGGSGGGSGTVTSITAGSGLTGGTISTSGTIALSPTPTLGTAGTTLGTLTLSGNTSGTVKITPQAVAGTAVVVTLPNASGTAAVSASAPLSLSATTGALSLTYTVPNIQIFTSGGTYTPTSGLIYAKIECIGAGGGGAGVTNVSAVGVASAGGGAGSYSITYSTAATIGASQTVTIGTAGTAGTAGSNTGGTGGDTSVGTLCVGKGGNGGHAAVNTASFGLGGLGGVAGTGTQTQPGASGGGGTYVSSSSLVSSGAGGSTLWGGGGLPVFGFGTAVAGNAGTGFGAGGSGAAGNNGGGTAAGGAGTAGRVIITEYFQ